MRTYIIAVATTAQYSYRKVHYRNGSRQLLVYKHKPHNTEHLKVEHTKWHTKSYNAR